MEITGKRFRSRRGDKRLLWYPITASDTLREVICIHFFFSIRLILIFFSAQSATSTSAVVFTNTIAAYTEFFAFLTVRTVAVVFTKAAATAFSTVGALDVVFTNRDAALTEGFAVLAVRAVVVVLTNASTADAGSLTLLT